MTGIATVPLTWAGAVTTWRPDYAGVGVFAVLAAGYLVLLRRVDGWPAGRTAAFLAGAAVAVVAVTSAVDVYSRTLYWLHMVQHLTLIMLVPSLLAFGRPLLLLAEAVPATRGVLGGRVVAALTAPGLSLAVYAVVLVGTHLTPFLALSREYPWLHGVEIAAYLVSGYLFVVTLFGGEPIRWQLSYPLRMFLMLTGMGVDTIVGVILMMTVQDPLATSGMVPNDWGPSARGDLNAGGAIMWVFGDGLMVLIAVYVIGRWLREPRDAGMGGWLESVRSQHFAEATGTRPAGETIDEDEENLAAYNEMLARLSGRSERGEDERGR